MFGYNQLIGYTVVGLNGTGDKVSLLLLLSKVWGKGVDPLGIAVPQVCINPKNVAAVVVHANTFTKPGQKIDITVSSVGDSKSPRGGSLLMTPLKGIDGKVYALARATWWWVVSVPQGQMAQVSLLIFPV